MFSWLEGLVSSIASSMGSVFEGIGDTIVNAIWDSLMKWLFNAFYDSISDVFTQIGSMGAEIFDLSWVESAVRLFFLFGWVLFGVGVIVAVFDIAIGYGFGSRVEWCAIFASWCANQCGYIDAGIVPKFAGCGVGVQWFQNRGQWLPGSATPEPGMLIFFQWYGSDSSIADHVGIVESVADGRVYTIEGNSNDQVRRNSYPVGYGEIKGYGVPVTD